ncbi:translation initiation factor IF-2 [Candidatus Saccharibacteria bacterium]|nr:translation initiation factor IF-2 [Candidatus Saccharibacteria bacterium]MCA9328307.1 translation initiation factor IF-2 [Candidatus Saccharibacteria bacterium]
MAKEIQIDSMITVGTLAEKLDIPATKLIGELFKNGMMVTVNEKIDADTAQIIIDELGLEATLVAKSEEVEAPKRQKTSDDPNAKTRPPVIAVMGHVDHGKTSLLDRIRNASVAAGESGGITQHISAYQITHKASDGDRVITFLDTPGHEAFAALREHGAYLTDLVVIVVAADDGIKPQTLEAIRFARKAGVKMLVAANKMDKEGADINRLKQQLAEQELLPEDWGGDTVVMPVSAKTGDGVNELIDMILLMADVEGLRAVESGPATGLVIESHMEQGKGPTAVVLVEQGTLKQGDFVVAGDVYAKVRTLNTPEGKSVGEAGPSTPVIVSGFKALPEFGTPFDVVANEKEARSRAEEASKSQDARGKLSGASAGDLLKAMSRTNELQELNVIVKADVQGSLTSVVDSLKTLNTEEVAIKVIGSGVGSFTENDLYLASTSGAILYGFHVDLPSGLRQLAARDNLKVRIYKVIYELLDDAKNELSALLAPEVVITDLGRLKVKQVFKTTRTEVICGGEVTKGNLAVPSNVKIYRDKEEIADVEAVRLQRGPQEVKEVMEGELCGVSLKTESKLEILEGDTLEFYTKELKERTL